MTETPLAPSASVVVIGAGQAGFAAASKLRELGHSGLITLVGDEPELPYQRPPLSKGYLLRDLPRERLFLPPAEFFAPSDLTVIQGLQAGEKRRDTRQVVLSDGNALPYARLLLATGAWARRLSASMGGDLENVLTVRSLADADAMACAFQPSHRLPVVGGRYIGLEAAASAIKLGLQVTLIESADRILKRVTAAETSDYFRGPHLSKGVDLCEGVGLAYLIGAGGRVAGSG